MIYGFTAGAPSAGCPIKGDFARYANTVTSAPAAAVIPVAEFTVPSVDNACVAPLAAPPIAAAANPLSHNFQFIGTSSRTYTTSRNPPAQGNFMETKIEIAVNGCPALLPVIPCVIVRTHADSSLHSHFVRPAGWGLAA